MSNPFACLPHGSKLLRQHCGRTPPKQSNEDDSNTSVYICFFCLPFLLLLHHLFFSGIYLTVSVLLSQINEHQVFVFLYFVGLQRREEMKRKFPAKPPVCPGKIDVMTPFYRVLIPSAFQKRISRFSVAMLQRNLSADA